MRRKLFLNLLLITAISVVLILAFAIFKDLPAVAATGGLQDPGSLQVLDQDGQPKAVCPLKHTDVKAEITGFLSRVTVTQEFENPFSERIEAVYTFPLPQNAAVDDMTMAVGDRIVRGKILRREEAQAVYDAARSGGQVASLLDQERPNIFTQSVANILPGEKVKITISYVEKLKYEAGTYEFVFPMVVGPRYIPSPKGQPENAAANPARVPDASRITPKPAPENMRSGHDVSLEVTLDAGVPIDSVEAKSHQIDLQRINGHSAIVRLKSATTIPNKDFILKYDVAGKTINDALISHRSAKGGYFTLILQPPERITVADVTPKELVFVLDTSGSMEGFPIEKAKESMKLALDGLYPSDTFNLITFAGETKILFPRPVRATAQNLRRAQAFLASTESAGGTEMMDAIKAALDDSDSQKHVRIVCFMTDAYVGNDMEIVSEIQKHPNARVFAFGIGSSVNRFLLDQMAEQGRGEVEYVGLDDDGSAAARRFHERVRNPLLTDISVDWSGLPVADVYPKRIPDLFGAKPVVLTGRYTGAGRGVVRLKGKMSGHDFVREIPVDFPESQAQHDVLPSLWARARIDDLMSGDFSGAQQGTMKPDLKEAITNLGLEYRLMTQFTSFVAVEEMIVTDGGQPRRVDVPVEVPEGVNRDTAFGADSGRTNSIVSVGTSNFAYVQSRSLLSLPSAAVSVTSSGKTKKQKVANRRTSGGAGGGSGSGVGGKSGGGIGTGGPPSPAPNAPPIGSLRVLSNLDRAPDLPATQTKMHPAILALVERLKKGSELPGPDEVNFVRDGKAEVQIWMSDKSEEQLQKLKELGFEVVLDPKSARMVIGRIPIENLEALDGLTWVTRVVPRPLK